MAQHSSNNCNGHNSRYNKKFKHNNNKHNKNNNHNSVAIWAQVHRYQLRNSKYMFPGRPPKRPRLADLPLWRREEMGQVDLDAESDVEDEPELGARELDDSVPLVEMLLELCDTSKISSKQLCVLAHLAVNAGARGLIERVAKPDGDESSGHYARHISRRLGLTKFDEEFYMLSVPGLDFHGGHRTVHQVPVINPHEALAKQMSDDPGQIPDLDRAVGKGEWQRLYKKRCEALGDGPPPVPVALYVDGVQISTVDGVVGWWVVNLLTQRRECVCVLRQRHLCDCGCGAWCSYFAVLNWLSYCFRAAERGVFPSHRHDGRPWDAENDTNRMELAESPMPRRCVLVHLKMDWAEVAHTMGMPSWSSSKRPCFKCTATSPSLHRYYDITAFGLPWAPTTCGMYEAACRRCETRVPLHSNAQCRELANALRYHKQGSKTKVKGRSLTKALPDFGLARTSRLEPSVSLPDISQLEALESFPVEVCFWNPRNDSCARHRNPLLVDSGLELIAVDAMHTLHLGVFKECVAYFINALLRVDAFRSDETDEMSKRKWSAEAIKDSLHQFYVRYAYEHPLEQLSRIPNFTYKTIAPFKGGKPGLKAKAAQTWGILLWSRERCDEFRLELGEDAVRWTQSLETLITYWRVCQRSSRQLSNASWGELWHAMRAHLSCVEPLMPFFPKHHLWVHLTWDALSVGNPKFYTTFYDETLNKVLKQACIGAHQNTFEATVLRRMGRLLRLRALYDFQ